MWLVTAIWDLHTGLQVAEVKFFIVDRMLHLLHSNASRRISGIKDFHMDEKAISDLSTVMYFKRCDEREFPSMQSSCKPELSGKDMLQRV